MFFVCLFFSVFSSSSSPSGTLLQHLSVSCLTHPTVQQVLINELNQIAGNNTQTTQTGKHTHTHKQQTRTNTNNENSTLGR